jgi:hypothetical protein
VNPLFFHSNPFGNSNPPFFQSFGKRSPSNQEIKDGMDLSFSKKILGKRKISQATISEKTTSSTKLSDFPLAIQQQKSKTNDLSRWETFVIRQKDDQQTNDLSSQKTLWNYLLGESPLTDFVSLFTKEQKENLQMVAEENQTGFTLYLFWKAEGFGPFGIFFHFEPQNEKSVRIKFVTEPMGEERESSNLTSLQHKIHLLLRDFPQIGSISFEDWEQSSFNGDYR